MRGDEIGHYQYMSNFVTQTNIKKKELDAG